FFSSRRRHTRSYGDWSSDVCSSDLDRPFALRLGGKVAIGLLQLAPGPARMADLTDAGEEPGRLAPAHQLQRRLAVRAARHRGEKIGRASCRERGRSAARAAASEAAN